MGLSAAIIFIAGEDNPTAAVPAAALCRKLDGQAGDMKSPKHKAGAAFVYYIRCAIVHAGGKDMIFESYPDSDALLGLLKEHMEEAAFALAGLGLRS